MRFVCCSLPPENTVHYCNAAVVSSHSISSAATHTKRQSREREREKTAISSTSIFVSDSRKCHRFIVRSSCHWGYIIYQSFNTPPQAMQCVGQVVQATSIHRCSCQYIFVANSKRYAFNLRATECCCAALERLRTPPAHIVNPFHWTLLSRISGENKDLRSFWYFFCMCVWCVR